ncbi:Muskelin N-terminus-domain-containing protein [Radiomyces spectabilis]|uniref:Muskelin N-terminus-domain-containing protein n=1 Tax=Radiomyces spectabilis TaxID=64574 RepID=UPI00221F4806|nr:Muskelin N-terminus-domain-containing protein [Radiomyces spectabilis]KAI8368114.1 Muskelin N-terminus-domain-containing protein [Radiomyces spectabilis]
MSKDIVKDPCTLPRNSNQRNRSSNRPHRANKDRFSVFQQQPHHTYDLSMAMNPPIHSLAMHATAFSYHDASKPTMGNEANTASSLVANTMATPLPYFIYDYSSQSGSYHPQNICENNPAEQSSRWSSGAHDQSQFITIAFENPVVAKSILFGKFHRGHVCNLKEFKIFGGLDPDNMTELLHHGLRNDTQPETFSLKYSHKNLVFPIQYIKIVPLATFGPNFNYSIWYIEVHGIADTYIMRRVFSEYENFQQNETTRLCLKYFRQRNMMDVFHVLKNRTGIQLEHPLLTELHDTLIHGDFDTSEKLLHQAYEHDIFLPYANEAQYTAIWKKISPVNEDGDAPCARGGHQMCIDIDDRKIYLLGGWNGKRDLADFWCYNISEQRWRLLSSDTREKGGPTPRSCHKICFDPVSRSIFVLGRYVESLAISDTALESDFYRYYVDFDQWTKISHNTAQEGGPELIFDHQMCVDSKEETLYIFGGRIVCPDPNVHSYSGLYAYHIGTNTWKLIRNEEALSSGMSSPASSASSTAGPILKSRVGHSMLFDHISRDLYIFAGQRVKDYLADLYRYSVDTDTLYEVTQDYSKDTGPDAGFTQRATMDVDQREFHVLSGYMRNQGCDVVKNAFWIYNLDNNRWKKIYQNENKDPEYWQRMDQVEPRPRFAHQMVYDPKTRTQYLFGGNPGDHSETSKRLDDFWELSLVKPDPKSILRRCRYLLRMQKLREMSRSARLQQSTTAYGDDDVSQATLNALQYLRTHVAPLVNHEREDETLEFRQMCAQLCLPDIVMQDSDYTDYVGTSLATAHKDVLYGERTRLFENLLEYIPEDMKEPTGQLVNAVKLV